MSGVSVISRSTGARAWVAIREQGDAYPWVASALQTLAPLLLEVPEVTDENWEALTDQAQETIKAAGVRQTLLLGVAGATAIAQNLTLRDQRLIRSLVLIDPTSRPHPSALSRLVDSIESRLPLGLPLRLGGRGFDARPFLQRLRVPLLVITGPLADAYHHTQAAVFEAVAPNAWALALDRGRENQLGDLLSQIQEAPLRCPRIGA